MAAFEHVISRFLLNCYEIEIIFKIHNSANLIGALSRWLLLEEALDSSGGGTLLDLLQTSQ